MVAEASRGTPAQGRELRARGKRTLRKLLDAGAAVFAERGFHAARVDDVVKLAKTSHGTFYLYFSNKEELFSALAGEVADEMLALAASLGPVEPDGDGERALRAWLERFADLYQRHGAVIRAWTEAETAGSDARRLGVDVLARFSDALAERIAETGTSGVDPRTAAVALVAMVERCNYYLLAREVDVGRDRMLDTLAAVAHAGVFAPR